MKIDQTDCDFAFSYLQKELKHTKLPTGSYRMRTASPGEFMYMNSGTYNGAKVAYMKHSPSRNYLLILLDDNENNPSGLNRGRIIVPLERVGESAHFKPFFRGTYDA